MHLKTGINLIKLEASLEKEIEELLIKIKEADYPDELISLLKIKQQDLEDIRKDIHNLLIMVRSDNDK